MESKLKFVKEEKNGRFLVRHFRIKKDGDLKTVKYYSFPTEKMRDNYIQIELENEAKHNARIEKNKADKNEALKNFENPFKVGDILYSSWGYEQTNVDFYQITEVKGRMIKYKEIAQTDKHKDGFSSMSSHVSAIKDAFLKDAKEMKSILQVRVYEGQTTVHIAGRYGISLWDGREKYCSWYA